ncbi:ABC transporter ATP-binding/permease protein like [Thalictrum thalictroides]|uniref:ABC transporter ATP-binding/permease protein like n=1 Tax=Thalictrum thalictroides TaxID=46969 RepID=A0A7J6XC36_THATH|nr:ABC transporter ATP-binding/permease protein like [Thalictrum thalictroides]
MASGTCSPPKVQHVTKASSDELLRKFAEMDSESPSTKTSRKRDLQIVKGSKKCRRTNHNDENCESPSSKNGVSLVERKSLLPRSSRRSAVLRQIGFRRVSQLRAKELKHKSLLGTIEKTWRKTVEGASKLFMENHYNRHKRLINDVV